MTPHSTSRGAGPPVIGSFASLARRVLDSRPRLGTVRLVAVDGPSGAGKTVFAGRLATAIAAAATAEPTAAEPTATEPTATEPTATAPAADGPVTVAIMHTDAVLDGWAPPLSVWPRLRGWVLDPLARGMPGAFREFDWTTGGYRVGWLAVPVPTILILEGVTSACADVRPQLSVSVLVTAGPAVRLARVLARDGTGVAEPLRAWRVAEDRYFGAQRIADHVDLVVDGAADVGHDPDREFVRRR